MTGEAYTQRRKSDDLAVNKVTTDQYLSSTKYDSNESADDTNKMIEGEEISWLKAIAFCLDLKRVVYVSTLLRQYFTSHHVFDIPTCADRIRMDKKEWVVRDSDSDVKPLKVPRDNNGKFSKGKKV